MEYHETAPPVSLAGLVKAFWTLEAGGRADDWIEHQATPDGCIELIARFAGRSRWGGEQPTHFVVGFSQVPVTFEISGDARFAGVRLWPWTWRALSGAAPDEIFERWSPVANAALERIFDTISAPSAAADTILQRLGPQASALRRRGSDILESRTAGEISRRTRMSPRQLQRWFAENVGVAPRTYLRLLRFQQAFEELSEAEKLAHHAVDHGFADQAHMAREFRRLAGQAASRTKGRSKGPFLT